jgi:outer membrane protein assembly factor BamB
MLVATDNARSRQLRDVLMRFLLAATLIASIQAPILGQEWTRFRGPNGAGQSESIFPAKFNPANYAWKKKLPGAGHSSPVLWGNKLFVLGSDRKTATRMVICMDAKSGAEHWAKVYLSETHKLHSRSSYASCTPAVDEQRVYLAWSTHRTTTFMALDHDGEEIWKLDLGRWVGSHGFGTSPMLYKDMVILHNSLQVDQLDPDQGEPGEGFMLAVDRKSGKEIWRSPRPGARVCYSVPAIYQPPDGGAEQLICCDTKEGIFSLNPLNGELNWKTEGLIKMRSVSSPVIAGGLILGSTGSGGGGNYVVAIRPGNKPEIAYQIRQSAPYVPTPVAYNGLLFLFFDKGVVSCVDLSTGSVYWRERLSEGFSGSPIRVGDKVYCISDVGELICVAASKQFKMLGESNLGEPSRSTPAVHKGRMYMRTNSHLICVDQSSS